MILNLWTNFEFSNLWNYHFTLYALKCKKVKLMVAKWGVNNLLTALIVVSLLDNLGTCIIRVFHLPDVICVAMKNQTRVVPWLTCVLLYDWPLILATYSVYVSPFDLFIIYSLLRSTRYSFIGSRVSSCLAYVLTIFSPCVTIWLVPLPTHTPSHLF